MAINQSYRRHTYQSALERRLTRLVTVRPWRSARTRVDIVESTVELDPVQER